MNSRNSAETGNWVDVTGVVVQMSMPGTGWTMSRVVVTLDDKHCNDLAFLERIFTRFERLQKARDVTRDEERVLRIMDTPPARYGSERTRDLPLQVTYGIPCVIADMPIEHSSLPPGLPAYLPFRESNLLPCRAETERGGRVVMLPFTWGRLHENEEYFLRQVQQNGVRLFAARIQANNMLYEPQRLSLPGLVLITFERDEVVSKQRLTELAEDIYALKEQRPRNRTEEEVRDIVMASEQKGMLYRRRLLPRAFTGGPEVYAADLMIRPHYLRHRFLTEDDRFLPVVAERGSHGAIEHLPYWEITGELAPHVEEVAEAIPVETEPNKIFASRRSASSGGTATAEAIQVAPKSDGWLDVTADVLQEPDSAAPEVAVAVEAEPVRARPTRARRSRGPMLAVIILAVVAVVGGGGAVVGYFGFRTHEQLHLSNPRVVGMGLAKTATVSYETKGQPDAGYRYFAVVHDRQTGLNQQMALAFPNDVRGEINLAMPFRPLMPMGRVNDFDVYVEREPADSPGKREKISNSILLRY
jgi:hypothetical protein